ncbi:quinoprotein dehydrogenase-associated SoxYZ-like carrier [Rhodovulum euryhalinum]|uniref:Sulfur-oxidizing protein SoxY n=1 Tax=Rhodovulum euryhalinum TaxID=35805 RepID=A0A4R2KLV1_9RHOB|nr:quinoprotein dehydrogenase-associated SoxYZ-like carrier [Rhodovulum euryhalinum]TCO71676.1 sulfur-oxidizing protein SoxY [Rhodovulum euryhalinum]
MHRRTLCLTLGLALVGGQALARTAWDDLKPMIFDDRALLSAGADISITSPYRTDNDSRTPVGVRVAGPGGRLVARVTVILDENPMPVSAVIDLAQPLPEFFFELTLRFNGPTPMHVVAETTDGQLFVAEAFVKTSGQGACASPPITDPEAALAALGQMTIEMAGIGPAGGAAARLGALAHRQARVDVDIRHPSLSGLQKDQVTLLFIPMRYVQTLDVALDGQPYATVTGSISLSENPRISLAAPAGTRSVDATMTDTDGTVTHAKRSFPGY